ncbi:hypothetical protein Y032_0173g412 [Ancylostoma ceylanicum]|uniref:Uncharacterized protein n=1 Tax=Ancylostoma ceylanicum TaxID=53326 RepID=A0A016SUV1_9BILA|nr:hypothetical protein Y032_0173g412 [Ancylostoma ceylanicum]
MFEQHVHRRHFMIRTFLYAACSDVFHSVFLRRSHTHTRATLKNSPSSFTKHPSSQRRVRCTAHVGRDAKNCADTCVAIRHTATGSEGARQYLATTDSFNHLQRLLSLKSFRELVFVSDETVLLT